MGANVEVLARDYQAGHSLRVVGQMHSLSGQYVQRVLRQAGVPIRESGKRSPKVSGMIWSPEAIEKLRHLWAENLSTRAIGNELGCNKNSVIGKAHRLGLPARQNPSAFQGGRKRDRERAERAKLPAPKKQSSWHRRREAAQERRDLAQKQREEAARAASVQRMVFVRLSRDGCQFPFGDPGAINFRFCEAATPLGRPYCAEHHAVCYVRASEPADV